MTIKGDYIGTPRGNQIDEMTKKWNRKEISDYDFQHFLLESSKHSGKEKFCYNLKKRS